MSGIAGIGDQPALSEDGKPEEDDDGNLILLFRFDYVNGGREAWARKIEGDVPEIVKTRRWLARSLLLVVKDWSRMDLAGGFGRNGRL